MNKEKYIWILVKDSTRFVGSKNQVAFSEREHAVEFVKKLLEKVDEVIDVVDDYTIVDCVEMGALTSYRIERCICR